MPSTNGAKPRTKTDQLIDGAVGMKRAMIEMDHQQGKMDLALQQMLAGMSAPVFQRYSDSINQPAQEGARP